MYFCRMSKLLKTAAIFFSSVLFFTSIITEKYCFALNSKTLISDLERLSTNPPFENPNVFLLNRHSARPVAPVKNLPVFSLRNQTIDIHSNLLSYEPGKLRKDSEYIQSSGTIIRNLTTTEIVFPFHYFW
jgi:hypothetical protein